LLSRQQESLGQIAEQDETPPQETDSSGQEVQQTQQGEATSQQQQEQPTQQTVIIFLSLILYLQNVLDNLKVFSLTEIRNKKNKSYLET
jgi:hypothetical protein